MTGTVTKGIPLGVSTTADQVSAFGWNVANGSTATPVATINGRAITSNARAMAHYCLNNGVSLAPHGKTTLSAELIELQRGEGMWGITAALPRQVALFWEQGISRVLLANEVTDTWAIQWLSQQLDADPSKELWLYVDSIAGVRLLNDALGDIHPDRPLNVLVELGYVGGRTGARTMDGAVSVGRAVCDSSALRLAGVATYEGTISSSRDASTLETIDDLLRSMITLAHRFKDDGLFETPEPIVTAGGSVYFDRVIANAVGWCAENGCRLVIRSGCYLTHDHGMYEAGIPAGVAGLPEFEAALSVWARVVSLPEPGLALLDAGRRDLSHDAGLPTPLDRHRNGQVVPLRSVGATISELNDQHAYLTYPAALDLQLGDIIRLGVSHPCTTLDRWRSLLLVDDDSRVIGAARTSF